uniref:Uncharacterized protein n=1 Tax=Rhizophora mucronata TaxID=61149 RepID=A0A2P2J3T9_RHIMU
MSFSHARAKIDPAGVSDALSVSPSYPSSFFLLFFWFSPFHSYFCTNYSTQQFNLPL